jgi:hypothetical protein
MSNRLVGLGLAGVTTAAVISTQFAAHVQAQTAAKAQFPTSNFSLDLVERATAGNLSVDEMRRIFATGGVYQAGVLNFSLTADQPLKTATQLQLDQTALQRAARTLQNAPQTVSSQADIDRTVEYIRIVRELAERAGVSDGEAAYVYRDGKGENEPGPNSGTAAAFAINANDLDCTKPLDEAYLRAVTAELELLQGKGVQSIVDVRTKQRISIQDYMRIADAKLAQCTPKGNTPKQPQAPSPSYLNPRQPVPAPIPAILPAITTGVTGATNCRSSVFSSATGGKSFEVRGQSRDFGGGFQSSNTTSDQGVLTAVANAAKTNTAIDNEILKAMQGIANNTMTDQKAALIVGLGNACPLQQNQVPSQVIINDAQGGNGGNGGSAENQNRFQGTPPEGQKKSDAGTGVLYSQADIQLMAAQQIRSFEM